MNRKRILLWAGIAAGGAALTYLMPAESPVSGPLARSERQPSAEMQTKERFAALPSREPIADPKGELFGPRAWIADAPAPAARKAGAPPVISKPVAPPIPYRIVGQVVQEDGMRIVLAKADRIFEVREGDALDDGFRIQSIAPHAVTFLYLPLGLVQEVPVAGMRLDLPPMLGVASTPAVQRSPARSEQGDEAAAQAAQVRFAGPQEVRAGQPFDVALKLTSQQPVQALPLQLSFDAKRLEPLAVRAGDLFPGGSFIYRVNPAGFIFVGASGKGRAARDVDFLIVSFRPIASGPAELKISSLVVQGAAGRVILHEPPQAFRASIVQ